MSAARDWRGGDQPQRPDSSWGGPDRRVRWFGRDAGGSRRHVVGIHNGNHGLEHRGTNPVDHEAAGAPYLRCDP